MKIYAIIISILFIYIFIMFYHFYKKTKKLYDEEINLKKIRAKTIEMIDKTIDEIKKMDEFVNELKDENRQLYSINRLLMEKCQKLEVKYNELFAIMHSVYH